MGQLIQLENEDVLKEGADPCQLWKAVKELYDKLNDLTITIIPSDAGHVETEEGNFNLALDVITHAGAINSIPGYAPPDSSETDSSSSGSTDAFSGAQADGSTG